MRAALLAISLLVPLTMTANKAAAQTANRAAGCVLPNIVRAAIQVALNVRLPALNGGTAGSNLSVDAIVIHSVTNDNEGQPLDGGGFTGPIVCTFSSPLPVGTPYNIASTGANTPINGIDLLASEIQTQVQYRRNSNNVIEKLMCLTTRNNNDCFRISPAP
jgi:hypothetical protein